MKTPYYKVVSRRRPKDKPEQYQDITATIAPYVARLGVHDHAGQRSDSFKLELADDGTLPLPSEGALLDVELGYKGEPPLAYERFRVDQIAAEGPPAKITFSATGAAFDSAARAPRERTIEPDTLAHVLATLAADYDVEPVVIPRSLGTLELPLIDQAGVSDLDQAAKLAHTYGGVFKPVNGKWQILSYDRVRAADPDTVITLGADRVTEWSTHFIARHRYKSVTAHYHDYGKARRVPVTVGNGTPNKILDKTFETEAIARAHARATYYTAERERRRLRLSLPGRPDVATHTKLALRGFRDRVNADWLITQVDHVFDDRGYRTTIQAEGLGDDGD
ncbi:phage late control D family protein [Salinisphaera orenii]|uniref:phage late control D family protein n=1 Tax=Salinisphaera orenii TaxID=856731 RepID=UPI000DBE1859